MTRLLSQWSLEREDESCERVCKTRCQTTGSAFLGFQSSARRNWYWSESVGQNDGTVTLTERPSNLHPQTSFNTEILGAIERLWFCLTKRADQRV